MFTSENVATFLKHITIRVEKTKAEVKRRMECKFVIAPVTIDLAREIDTSVASHLFVDALVPKGARGTRTHVPRSDIADVTFQLKIPAQRLVVRSHPELKTAIELDEVAVHKVRARRPVLDEPLLELSFLTTFDLPGAKDLVWLIARLNEEAYLSFAPMQADLPMTG